MKILYLKLVNFAPILSAMKRRSIEIDLRKSKNRVVLFIGDNGTGKTAILSQLHPFATTGNGDVRNGSDQIIKNADDTYEEGYKEIHIQHNGDLYIIKHHYLYKSNKGMKSYISKNGKELNPNGNVTSFVECVEGELMIAQNYLKLLRLGPNVKTFITMKASERKDFAGELLNDIDIYTQYFKKINNDSRVIKSLLKSVADKIDKLKVYDEKEEQRRMENFQTQLETIKSLRDEINGIIGGIDGSISVLVPDGLENFIADIKVKDSEIKRIIESLKSKKNKLGKMNLIIVGDIDKTIKATEKELSEKQNKVIVNKNMIEFYFNQLNALSEQKKDKEDNLKFMGSELEYEQLSNHFLELHRQKEKMDKKFKGFTPKCTREDMLTALSILQEMEKFASDINEFDGKASQAVLEHYLKNESVEQIARREVVRIDERANQLHIKLSRIADTSNVNPNAVYVLFTPEDHPDDCPYRQFYEDVMGKKEDSPREKIMTELKQLETKREYFMMFPDIAKKIDYILLLIKTNKKLIERMPENFFDIKHILTSIKSFTPFYEEEYITNYVAFLEEYEDYVKLDDKIKEVQREKTFIEKNSGSIVSAQKELQTLDSEIHNIEKELSKIRNENNDLNEQIEHLENLLEDYAVFKSLKEEEDEEKQSLQSLSNELDTMRGTHERISELMESKFENKKKLEKTNQDIASIEREITATRFRLMEFESLNSEKKQLEESFEEIALIKDALSSNKGIPLLFIQLYLKNTRVMINQLLDSVYKGELELDEFDINEKEFKLPYFKNGVWIDDVVKCSQGEETFVSMALSFALIEQSMKGYNIMLLDEIDAALDTDKRMDFLSILEAQLDSIDAEQVFLITHNNVFDSYPVDIIMTSNKDIDNYKNTNIIYKAA